MVLTITLAVMFSVLALFAGIYFLIGPDQGVEERLDAGGSYRGLARERGGQALGDRVNARLRQGQFGSKLSREIVQAGVSLTAAEFVAINVGLVAAALLLGFVVSQTFVAGIGLAALAGLAPRIWLKQQRAKRLARFQDQLPDVLNMVVGSLRAGYGLIQSMKLVSQEMPAPSGEEYRRVVDEISLGFSLQQALDHLVERMESDDLMMVVTAVNIQNEVGGNLGHILESIAQTIKDRVKLQGEIRALTGMQRATGYMLAGMPFVVGALLLFINTEYIMQMFVFPWIVIPIGAVVNIVVGIVVMNNMIDIDV